MNEFYRTVTFTDPNSMLINNMLVGYKEDSPKESGVIFANYIPVTRTEPDPEYNAFLKQYALDHALCRSNKSMQNYATNAKCLHLNSCFIDEHCSVKNCNLPSLCFGDKSPTTFD